MSRISLLADVTFTYLHQHGGSGATEPWSVGKPAVVLLALSVASFVVAVVSFVMSRLRRHRTPREKPGPVPDTERTPETPEPVTLRTADSAIAEEGRALSLERILEIDPVLADWWGSLNPYTPERVVAAREEAQQYAQQQYLRLFRELTELSPRESGRIYRGFLAASRLGYWSDMLCAALVEQPGQDPPPPEWTKSFAIVREFATVDAAVCRRAGQEGLGRAAGPLTVPGYAEGRFLETSGWLDTSVPFPARWRRYMGPEGARCFSRFVLALQYLAEAFPREEMVPENREELSRRLDSRLEGSDLPRDLHSLAVDLASSFGYLYQPVPYYRDLNPRAAEALAASADPQEGPEARARIVIRLAAPILFDSQTGKKACGNIMMTGASDAYGA